MPHHYAKLSKSKTTEATWSAEAVAGVVKLKVQVHQDNVKHLSFGGLPKVVQTL